MKKVNKTDAATLLNNFKVDLYITALTAVEIVLITHSVMYCEIFSTHYHGNVLNTRVVIRVYHRNKSAGRISSWELCHGYYGVVTLCACT